MNIRDILLKLTDALGMKDQAEDQPTMMPPQTQELELLKKAAGVPSKFDYQPAAEPEEPSCGCGGAPEEEPEELMACDQKVGEESLTVERLRKLSGL